MKRSEISRRHFLATAMGAAALALPGRKPSEFRLSVNVFPRGNAPLPPIDRKSVIDRHSPSLYKLDPLSPLSVGNGEFAFTADITGLQTFPRAYENAMPLCTMSHWGWHTSPLPSGLDPQAFRLTQYDTHGRQVGYQTSSEGQSELYKWLRENPHRLHLGQVGLRLWLSGSREAEASDISGAEQRLDLRTGILTSRFKLEGESVTVKNAVHPDLD